MDLKALAASWQVLEIQAYFTVTHSRDPFVLAPSFSKLRLCVHFSQGTTRFLHPGLNLLASFDLPHNLVAMCCQALSILPPRIYSSSPLSRQLTQALWTINTLTFATRVNKPDNYNWFWEASSMHSHTPCPRPVPRPRLPRPEHMPRAESLESSTCQGPKITQEHSGTHRNTSSGILLLEIPPQ